MPRNPQLSTQALEHFTSLADTLHFGRASEACNVSPSTLSRSIQQLEENLGVQLFLRDNRRVELTHEGELFQDYAREALGDWQQIRLKLLSEAEELRGELSIYCSVTASYSFLYELLSEFRISHPHIAIKLHTGDPASTIPRVLSGDEDAGISARPDNLPAGLAFKAMNTSPLLFIAPRDAHWQALAGEAAAGQWASTPMILSERDLARQRVNAWFRDLGIKPRIYAQVSGNEAIVSMVSLGLGVGVVPRIVLDNSPLADTVQVLSVSPELTPYEVGLCVQQRQLKNPLIRALWEQLPGPGEPE